MRLSASAIALCCVVVASTAVAQPRPLAGDGGRVAGREPYRVFLHSMTAQRDRYNDVDRWLVDLARADGRPNELDSRDFIRAMSDRSVDAFLSAARTYIYRRWAGGDRSEDVVSEFLDAISRIALPPRYTVLMVYGNSDISGMRHGHLIGVLSLGSASAESRLDGFDLAWSLQTRSIGGESLWAFRADPYVDNRLLLYLGIGLDGLRGKGTVSEATSGVEVPVDLFGFRLHLNAHLRFAVRPWISAHASIGAGFGIGTLRANGPVRDQLGTPDPCNLDLSKLAEADDAVRCTISNALGFYDTFPVQGRLGLQLFGWLVVEGVYAWDPIFTADTHISPPSLHRLEIRAGIVIY
ncbi:MAG: hypothetical protein H6747_14035 [Deltaproteobacteria bacterium]|nr:hypothetical protein [Deltaproteobacteria bacterium]